MTRYDNAPVRLDGPNMQSYEETCRSFAFSVPEHFNYGFDVVDHHAVETPTKVALLWADRSGQDIRRYTFADLRAQSNRFANALRGLGVGKGERVFVMVPRLVEWYAVMLGCFKVGAVPMPAANILVPRDVEYRVNQAEASVAVMWHENAAKIDEVRVACPSLRHLVCIGAERPGWHAYEALCAAASPLLARTEVATTRADDNLLIYFTSGTTKFPKMVAHTHASYGIGHILTAKLWQDLKPSDVHWTLSDTGWAKAAWGKLFGQWQIGCTVVAHDAAGKFDAKTHLELIGKLGVTTFCAPPTAYRMLILEDLSKWDLSSIRHSCSAGEPLNPEVIRAWKAATGTTIYDGFGQTESVNLIANYPCKPVKPGAMGLPVPGFVIDVVDDEGKPMPIGDEGHIAVRTEPHPVGLFREYWRDPEATAAAFHDGWYFTGDKAKKDADGYFWFVGRSDDVIKASGYRIGPFEVESALQSHPAVAESAVVGSPDELRGMVVKAFVILRAGVVACDDLVKELQEHVKRETAPYKYPREIEFVTELPKTVSGKIRRVELRKLEEQRKRPPGH
jgi:acyl-coenzyme A synthetase/AMP-(fatty) acid ligase